MDLHLHRVPPRENKIAYAALQRWRMNEDEQRPSDKHRATLGGPWTNDEWIDREFIFTPADVVVI